MKKARKVLRKLYQSFWSVIHHLIFAKISWLSIIDSVSYEKFVIIYLFFFLFGRLLLCFNPIRFDWLHQIFLTMISFMVIFSLKYAYSMTQKLKDASSGLIYDNSHKYYRTKTMKMIVDQMENAQNSVWWLVVMLFPAINFIRKNFYLGFIQRNPAGYYAVIFAASTYYIALLGYAQIIIALICFGKIACDDGNCIPLDFPDDVIAPPTWLSIWIQLFQKIVIMFFCVGALFTIEYILLMPKDIVTIEDGKYIFNVCDVKAFLISWGTISGFIIIAFPVLSLIIKKLQKLLIKNLNKKINKEYKFLFSNDVLRGSALDLWVYKQLMESSITYEKYVPSRKSIIPILSTLISLSLNVVKFYESILRPLICNF